MASKHKPFELKKVSMFSTVLRDPDEPEVSKILLRNEVGDGLVVDVPTKALEDLDGAPLLPQSYPVSLKTP